MNQNRNQNRRRGRGSNRGGQGGGGNQGNRIDSRARGNAPQMLEKYKKLAHDASLNGDRVLTEYYLQFADHYFRVVADMRTQKDDQRPPRQHDRDQPYGTDDYDSEDRDEQGRDEQPRARPERYEEERAENDDARRGPPAEEADEAGDENPFIRDAREAREPREPREPRDRSAPRGRGRGRPANDAREDGGDADGASTFDAAVLPPSIAREPEPEEADEAPRPAPRTRTRRARPVDDEGDEALEAVS